MVNKVEFRTAYTSRPDPAPSPTGDGFEVKREFQTMPDGTRNLVEVGHTNTYEIIQASLEQSLIYNILRRHAAGDPTALAAVEGRYMDVSGLPTSLAEMQALVMSARDGFDQLPIEVRRAYDFDAAKFVLIMGLIIGFLLWVLRKISLLNRLLRKIPLLNRLLFLRTVSNYVC